MIYKKPEFTKVQLKPTIIKPTPLKDYKPVQFTVSQPSFTNF